MTCFDSTKSCSGLLLDRTG